MPQGVLDRHLGSPIPDVAITAAKLREVWLVVFEGRWMVRGRFGFGAGH
jgi:hypothetical protein